jgi:hypothetical protein
MVFMMRIARIATSAQQEIFSGNILLMDLSATSVPSHHVVLERNLCVAVPLQMLIVQNVSSGTHFRSTLFSVASLAPKISRAPLVMNLSLVPRLRTLFAESVRQTISWNTQVQDASNAQTNQAWYVVLGK